MPRKKAQDQDSLFVCPVRTRITEKAFKRLERLKENSNCGTLGEVARKVLSAQEIKCFHIDRSLPVVMEELALIRKELRAIGVNINQLTKGFNSVKEEAHKAFYILKVMEQYKPAEAKVDRLLLLVSALTEKWLQK